MDAGTIWFEALSQAGSNIGKGLAERYQRKKQRSQMTDLVEFFSKMPRDPGAPAGTPGNKPLFDQKTAEGMRSFIATHDAEDAGFIQAYTKSAQIIAEAGAKARLASENIRPMYGLDANGNVVQLGERDERGHPHIYPKWTVEPNESGTDKQFNTSLGKFGLEQEDLKSVDEVHYLDQNKDPIVGSKARMKGRHKILGMHFGGKEVEKKRKPEELEKEAAFVKGKTKTGKSFGPIPIAQWRAWHNMEIGAQKRQRQGQMSRAPVRVNTREEALRLPPGTPIITPSGKVLVTPRVQQQPQQQMSAQTGDEEDASEESGDDTE